MRDQLDMGIVGGAYVPAGLILQGSLQPGDVLKLVPSPGDGGDPFAVRVMDSRGRQLGWVPNRGYHCGHCWEQVHGDYCSECGSGQEMIRSGGHATRIHGMGWLDKEIAVIVRKVDPTNKHVVAHATIYVKNP